MVLNPATRSLDREGDAPTPDEVYLNVNCKQPIPQSSRFANSHLITLASPQSAEIFVESLTPRYRPRVKGKRDNPRPILISQTLPHTFGTSGVYPCIREIAENDEEVNSLAQKAHCTETVMYLFPCPKLDVTHAPRYHLVLPLANLTDLDEQLAHKLTIFRHYILSFQTGQNWGVLIDQCLSVRGGFSLLATRALVQRASVLLETHIGITLFLHHSSPQTSLQPHNMRSVDFLTCNSHPNEEPLTHLCTWCLAQLSSDELKRTNEVICPNMGCETRQHRRSGRGRWSLRLETSSPQPLRRPNSGQPPPSVTAALPGAVTHFPPDLRPNPGSQWDRSPSGPSRQHVATVVGAKPAPGIVQPVLQSLGTVCAARTPPGPSGQCKQDQVSVFDSLIGDLTGRLDKIEDRIRSLESARGEFPPLEPRDQKWTLSHKTWEAWSKKVQKLQTDVLTNAEQLDQATKLCRQQQLSTEKSIARLDSCVRPSPPPIDITSPNSTPQRANTPTDALATPSSPPATLAE